MNLDMEDTLVIRPLAPTDDSKGFLELLRQLTNVGNVTSDHFCRRFRDLFPSPLSCSPYFIVVIEDEKLQKIVAAGTLFIEKKFIHHCGSVGHIEDVVVDLAARGHGLGRRIVEFLVSHARDAGCYKVLLDCSEDNVGFYQNCGFTRKEVHMAKYFQ